MKQFLVLSMRLYRLAYTWVVHGCFFPPLIPVWSRHARAHHPRPLWLLSELLFSVFEWQLVKRHWLFRGAEPRQSLTSNSGNKSRCVRRALIRSCTTVTGHDKGACCDIARLSCLFLKVRALVDRLHFRKRISNFVCGIGFEMIYIL